MRQNETTGRVDNLRKGAGLIAGDYVSRRFNDTDVYKVIEAASYTLVSHPDPALQKELDALIEIIGKAQQPDGYLFPARTINPQKPAPGVGTERWKYENTGSHETLQLGSSLRGGRRALSGDRTSGTCSTSRSRTRISCAPRSARPRVRTRPATRRSNWRSCASTA